MPATTPRKRKASSIEQGRTIAQNFYKDGTFTSSWTEHQAKTYFGMKKSSRSVLRTGQGDEAPVEWYLDENDQVAKKELTR